MIAKIDLHSHSKASDGTDSPEELLRKAIQADLKIFAITDHDTMASVLRVENIIAAPTWDNKDFTFIRGIEFSCKMANEKCHILGYNYDTRSPELSRALKAGQQLRHTKLRKRLLFLQENFGMTFSVHELGRLLRTPNVGKPHLANLMVEKGYASDRADAIINYINKCKTSGSLLDASVAIKAILDAGGIPVWAHPFRVEEDDAELSAGRIIEMLGTLINCGLGGIECYYSAYDFSKIEWLIGLAKKNGLLISGGSDYHGKNKNIPIGKLSADGTIILPEALTILNKIKIK